MLLLSVCSNPEILSVMKIVNIVILAIKIAVPIILILVGMLDMTRAITEKNEDNIKKTQQALIRKAIAAVIIFLVPSFVNLLVRIVNPDNEYLSCLGQSISADDLETAYESKASELVSKAEQTNSYTDYSIAVTAVSKITDSSVRAGYEARLATVYNIIQSKNNENNNNNNNSSEQSNGNNNSNNNGNSSVSTSGTLFMGDSRTNGIKINISLPSTDKVYAKDSGNKSDFISHATEVKSFLNSNSDKAYNIVLNYGVNDLSSDYCSAYKDFISSVDSKHKIYIVSVNPVNDNVSIYAKNASIDSFNQKIKSCISSISNVSYCDVYNKATISSWVSSYISSDGIHYNSNGYKFIYSNIESCIK